MKERRLSVTSRECILEILLEQVDTIKKDIEQIRQKNRAYEPLPNSVYNRMEDAVKGIFLDELLKD